ncbi:RNA-binding S4 domain-containing protein [Thermincola ferriacetica]|uniref:RNA-binding S4 domain-containing protein n=1 Tax=Thermincola ferriacetica TaxID=281456 RepID=A0A0L6VYE8_9FIRM|nr:photosystem II S4 domain protein [Thermincola ferriacetica]KNZ68236.1 RNA-binding S4 domain-containing protein [Thermincola ferriacetica]
MVDRSIIKLLPAEQRELGAKIIDKAQSALKIYQPVFTDFLDPGQQVMAKKLVSGIYGLTWKFDGGYDSAERKRMIIFPEDLSWGEIPECICCLQVAGNFRFRKATHRDFLGAVLNTGIRREKLGDIIVVDEGCQLIVVPEIKDYLAQNLFKIHQVPVKVTEISREELISPADNTKIIDTTVSSLRLDAVAGAGFGISRSKIAKYINSEKVKVNFETITDADYRINEGDVVSTRGLGRISIEKVKGNTRKGRIGIVIKRYL